MHVVVKAARMLLRRVNMLAVGLTMVNSLSAVNAINNSL
jgi:hypothetical protein